jgi:aldehyde dehydrogenase (NAD+)
MSSEVLLRKQFNRVMGYIAKGKEEGAKLVCGGERVGHEGYLVQPTIFGDCHEKMTIARDEIFGPVVCLVKFSDDDHVVRQANDTEYGLASAVHTKDSKLAMKVARKLEAGTVWINCYNVVNPSVPAGGYKQSGIGRELGEDGLHEYLQVKSVIVNVA